MQTWIPDAWRFPEAEQLDHLRELASHVAAYLDSVRGARSSVPPAEFDFVFGDASVILAITGERGGGKSSLLALLCRSLVERNLDIVIPTLRPEFFAEADSLVSAFCSSLWSILTTEAGGGPRWMAELTPEVRSHLSHKCLSAARSYAVSQTPSAALNFSSADPLEFAEESLVVSRSIARSHHDLADLVDTLLAHAPTAGPLVLLPVDDADLAPAQIGRILHDLRFVGSLPGVVPVACFDFADLRSGWLATRSVGIGENRVRDLSERLERELEKLFPQRARFNIPAVSPSRRRTFVPIGEVESLATRWGHLTNQFESLVGRATSLDVVIREAPFPLGLESPLPSTPRSLIQLWEALGSPRLGPHEKSSAGPGELAPDTRILGINRAIHILAAPLRHWCADNNVIEPQIILEADTDDTRPGTAAAQITLPEGDLGISTDRVFEDSRRFGDTAYTYLRSIHRINIDILRESAERSATGPRPVHRLRLPPGAAGAFLTLQEIALSSPRGYDQATYIGIDEWRFLQRTPISSAGSCETLAMLPCGGTLGEIIELIHTWNSLAAYLEFKANTLTLLTAIMSGARSYALARQFVAADDVQDDSDINRYRDAVQSTSALYEELRTDSSSRVESFRAWYEQLLPLQWHTAMFSEDQVDDFLDEHQDAVMRNRNREDYSLVSQGRHIRGDNFDRVIRLYLSKDGTSWLSGYLQVAIRLKSQHERTLRKLAISAEGGAQTGDHQDEEVSLGEIVREQSPSGRTLLKRALQALDEHETRGDKT